MEEKKTREGSAEIELSAPEKDTLPTIDWELRQGNPVRRFLNILEWISLTFERPIEWLVGKPTFNPLYHTGTLAVFFGIVLLVTGIYLTMFYQQFGFDASYQAVANIESNLVGRVMRALHRYASAALLLTSLLHGWRTFFMDRFRGPRWLAWVSGVLMTIFIWVIGVTGYWLLWDERAQLLNQTLIRFLQEFQWGKILLLDYLVTDRAESGWVFVLGMIIAHLGLSALGGLFFWLHIKRLSRPKIMPPRLFTIGLIVLLLIFSIAVPAGLLPAMDFKQLPGRLPVDLFYLFYLPGALHWPLALFWGSAGLLFVAFIAVPWLLARKPLPPIRIDAERCTGCTLCAADCPYRALTMVERTDGRPHKYIAQLDPKLCVACGICIGTCQPLAISLGNNPPEPLWKQTIARVALPGESPLKVVFACERHAFQGGRAFLDASTVGGQPAKEDDQRVMLVPLTCIGMLHPDLIGQTIRAGAEQVEIVGCPPEDCANREGNLWIQQRLDRNRLPKLRLAFAQAAIRSNWLSPLRFRKVFQGAARQGLVTAYEKGRSFRDWQSFLPVFVLLAGVLGLQVLLTSVPLRIYTEQPAYLQIALEHQVGNAILGAQQPVTTAYQNGLPARLVVELDDRAIFDRTYQRDLLYIFEQIRLDPGNHTLRILLFDSTGHNDAQILFARSIEISAGEIFPLDFIDAPMAGNPAAGEKIYNETSVGTNAGCRICHSLEPGVTLVGPSFAGVASRAAIRVPGQTAEEYLRQSILEPDAYVVSGFPAGLMVPNLDEKLTPQQINDLLAFLLTLK